MTDIQQLAQQYAAEAGTLKDRERFEELAKLAGEQWIAWFGGDCPVHSGASVDVAFPDSIRHMSVRAGDYDWSDLDCDSDIVAYRVVS